MDFLGREITLASTRCPGLLLGFEGVNLVLVALGLHLVAVVMYPQILNLQLQHLHLVLQPPVLHLLLHEAVVGFAELAEELLGILLQLLQSQRLPSPLVEFSGP